MPNHQTEWRNSKAQVFVCKEFKILSLGISIPSGAVLRVIKPIASDAAEVEWKGNIWTEIQIATP